MTPIQVEAAYNVASLVFAGGSTANTGADTLFNNYGVNFNSALDFIRNYRHMREGTRFRRSLSVPVVDHFLTRINADSGNDALRAALEAVRQHIAYYEEIRDVNLRAMRAVVARHTARLVEPLFVVEPLSVKDQEDRFNSEVEKSLIDSSSNRHARLNNAPKIPNKTRVVTELYLRNPDVVAEVLYRAEGVCERCRKSAPFKRKKDGTPYLEVHHKQMLANGGEDTVENAIALCPNCHRELHYGVEPA
jgi:5-methylcytosine-specific restriction enzyme A